MFIHIQLKFYEFFFSSKIFVRFETIREKNQKKNRNKLKLSEIDSLRIN